MAPLEISDETIGFEITKGCAGRLIRRTARRLARTIPRSASLVDDFEQDLRLEVLRRLPRFDPERGPWLAFVTVILAHKAVAIWETHRRHCACRTSGDMSVFAAPDTSNIQQIDLACDLADVLSGFNADVARLCGSLMQDSVAGVARSLQIARGSLRDRLRQIRRRFERKSLDQYLVKKPAILTRTTGS